MSTPVYIRECLPPPGGGQLTREILKESCKKTFVLFVELYPSLEYYMIQL